LYRALSCGTVLRLRILCSSQWRPSAGLDPMKNGLVTRSPGRARRNNARADFFGGLAVLVTCVTVDPLALRPRFSPGLPLSVPIVLLLE